MLGIRNEEQERKKKGKAIHPFNQSIIIVSTDLKQVSPLQIDRDLVNLGVFSFFFFSFLFPFTTLLSITSLSCSLIIH